MKLSKNLEGLKFGRLTVTKTIGFTKWKVPLYECLCSCGKITKCSRNQIACNRKNSCGCLRRELSREKIRKIHQKYSIIEHGHGKEERLYRIYRGILRRCRDLKDKDYGGRGIKCMWSNVVDFYSDMEESYYKHIEEFGEKNTTIERIDNDGNYCYENCKWATMLEQARNKRNVFKLIEFRGEKKTLKDWAKEMKVGYVSLYKALK